MNFQFSNIRRIAGWIAFYLLLSAPAFFPASANSGNAFVIRHARVFDGHNTLANTDVWVEGGKIKSVGKDLKVPSEVKVIDATVKRYSRWISCMHMTHGTTKLRRSIE